MMLCKGGLDVPSSTSDAMRPAYLQQLAHASYQHFASLLVRQEHQQPVETHYVVASLTGYDRALLHAIQLATEQYSDTSGTRAEEIHDDLLRLTMSSAILHLCRVFFFDDLSGDLSAALRDWFASFSAGAGANGGHLNILNPESCLEDGRLWAFLHRHAELPAEWKGDPKYSEGASSLGWRQIYALVTTGRLGYAWALLVQVDQQYPGVSSVTKEVVHRWDQLLLAGTNAGDFVRCRQALADDVEQHLRSATLREEERSLLQSLNGDQAAIGKHEPVNWIEHLIATLLYGRSDRSSFISPTYSKEFIGETLAEKSMDTVQNAAQLGREVCTFMSIQLFREVCVQQARGVLLQIADPEVAIGFTWLQMHLGHSFHVRSAPYSCPYAVTH